MAPWRTVPTELSWRLKTTKAIMDAHGWDYRAAVEDLPAEALDYLLSARKSEKVEVRYKHDRGENSYVATFEGVITNLELDHTELLIHAMPLRPVFRAYLTGDDE
jgi:excinuclease UvrABC ATPase subunit